MLLALPFTRPPHALLIDPIVRHALEEDFGRAGDLTSDLVVPPEATASAKLIARGAGVICGLPIAARTFLLVEPSISLVVNDPDGTQVDKGAVIATVDGPAQALLSAERVALNFVGHLSGIATATRGLVDAITGTKARVVCTRKTTPGLRTLEKYAVRCGGGFNHRFGLDDAVLIKDNHIVASGGIRPAVERARAGLGHMTKIEIEVDTLEQLDEALSVGVATILLDNMTTNDLKSAVALVRGRATLEASGGVSLASVRAIAETGVDYVSAGSITHSAPNLDVALDF